MVRDSWNVTKVNYDDFQVFLWIMCLLKNVQKYLQKTPHVSDFKISTRSGPHNYYEILTTKLTIPEQSEKKMMTEATVPVLMQSEAVWVDGDLHINIKDLGMIR